MQILVVNYEWPNVTANCGGGGRIGAELVAGLRDRGHDVDVLTDQADGHYATFPLRTAAELRERLRDNPPDVVHGQFAVPSSIHVAALARRYNVPFVCSVMGADVYDPTRFGAIRPAVDRVTQRVLDAADAVVAPSRDMQRRVHRKYDLSCEVIHYGIEPDAWTCPQRELSDPMQVLTVARLCERKNHDGAMQAMRHLRNEIDAEWQIVGTGPKAEQFAEYTADLPWATQHGYVDDLERLFTDADVFFLPSHHEAFGIVFLEALASGLPVVTSDHGGQTDIVRPAVGEMAPADATTKLADALATVHDNYEWFQRATDGYVAQHFHRDQMVAAYERTFQQLT